MSTQFTLRTVRTAGIAAAAAGTTYAGVSYYQRRSLIQTVHADAPTLPQKMTWSGFTELKLESAELVNHNVKRLRFALTNEDTVSGLKPVTSLLSKHTPEGGWIPVVRPYTPVSDPNDPGHVTFMIKKYPNGRGSGKMHSLVPGDSMAFRVLHEFDYAPNQWKQMTFIAGGSGITPIYQLTRAILRNPTDKTTINLVYANNTPEDILLRSEFDALEAEYPGRFTATYTVSKPGDTGDAKVQTGYVNKEMLLKALPKDKTGVKVLVSGPPPMTEAVAGSKGMAGWTQGSIGGILKELGYTSDDVHKF